MSSIGKEFAKFLSGMAVMQVLTHGALALSGDLPLTMLGITYTPQLNAMAVVVWSIIAILLTYYAWGRRRAA
ncbi:hypothetical protein [Caulobacter sp. UC70_42]|uniref:hypothetical protein n=1 Tax=Caulobacter sp. UC70_42 TaxID=3374551 RepID=UPI00375744CC